VTNAKILVVEDNSIVVMELRERLQGLGYVVSGVASYGEEAIEKASETRPDLVLMDIRLRGTIDGVEAAEQIRHRFDIPVIYLTSYVDEDTLQQAKVTEPYGYILKPFEERELHSSIEVALYKHKMERKLRESERWLATTLRSIGDGVIATDEKGLVTFMNPVAEALTGWKQEDALGRDLRELVHIVSEETGKVTDNPVAEVTQGGVVVGWANHILIAKEGREIPIDDSVAPIRDDKGNIVGVVLVFRDITERKKAEEALHQYAVELEARNEELDAFAHTVAHDLKNPLNLIMGFADLVKNDYATIPNEELQPCLHAIAKSGREMNNIVEELLLLAGLRKMEVEMRPLDMAEIVAQAQQRLAYMIDEHQAEITLPDTWPMALGYGPWVEEVWVNYLSNAIQYGGQPPRVELGATAQLDGMMRFWLWDNGPGISPEGQARLFTPFTRLDQVRTQGHGLGLSIVRRIVEKLGGQVGVEGEVGQGSVFSFTLPGVIT
jgi:PAS domain S-box-containing protein